MIQKYKKLNFKFFLKSVKTPVQTQPQMNTKFSRQKAHYKHP